MENVAKAGYKYVEYVSPRPNADGKVCSPEEIGNKLVNWADRDRQPCLF